jgi:hypothetical protein
MDIRIDTEPTTNGTHATHTAKPDTAKRKPARKTKPAPQPTPKPDARPAVVAWAKFGVAFMSVLSAALNGYANAQHSPTAWPGWRMGLAVPVIVLTLAKVAGEKWRTGQRWVGGLAGGSGVGLLFLSVWHCASSIAVRTGSPLALAMPMAIAIDCGLVACEIALITETRR